MSSSSSSSGIGFLGLLTVLFIGLKLTGYVAWSWWWVLSPLWLPWATLVFGGSLILLAVAVAGMLDDARDDRKLRNRRWRG